MKDISHLYQHLNPEHQKAVKELSEHREMTIEGFKLMRKDYSQLKNKVKKVEKKLSVVMEQAGDDAYVGKWIGHEVYSIEKKYANIEHGIKNYKRGLKLFNEAFTMPNLLMLHQNRFMLTHLRTYLSAADRSVEEALEAMRITKRYFKNIASAFEGHAKLMDIKKRGERRKWEEENKRIKESQADSTILSVPNSESPPEQL